jgi:hypothetical protein
VRERALALVGQFREESRRDEYAAASRAIAWQAGLDPAWYRLALRQAEVACGKAPTGFSLLALGVAQYRLGKYKDSLESLTRAEQQGPERAGPEPDKGALPVALGFLAMTHHRLGNGEQAQANLKRLRDGSWPDVEEVPALVYEASRLLGR